MARGNPEADRGGELRYINGGWMPHPASTIQAANTQYWAGKALSLSNIKWLKRALGRHKNATGPEAQIWRFFDMEQEERSVARPAESSCDEEIRK